MTAAEEVATKLARVRAWLDVADADGLLLGGEPWFAWATAGGRGYVDVTSAPGSAQVLVTRDGAWLLSSVIEADRLQAEEAPGLGFASLAFPWEQPGRARDEVATVVDPARVRSDLGQLGVPTAPADLKELRAALLPDEVARYRALGRRAAAAVEGACRDARPGATEHEVAAHVAAAARAVDVVPVVLLVGADERIARYRHPLPTAARLRGTLLVALTGRRQGLHASVTRMAVVGEPDAELVARHAAVQHVDAAVLLASRPGAALRDLYGVARDAYAAEGFPGEERHHHQGGTTGYGGREAFATPSAGQALVADQAVAWNPSIARVKSEDTALVTAAEPEVLTRTGSWPLTAVEVAGGVLERPALLQVG